jgi:hypothetical protein
MEGTTYPKIETLFNRDPKTFKVVGSFRRPEFGQLEPKCLLFTEKVDGTNIRINLGADQFVEFGGRTARADLPANLLEVLNERWRKDGALFESAMRWLWDNDLQEATLFGEGYGPKIQKGGGLYGDSPDFILFDILVDDQTWLQPSTVVDIAGELAIDHVPYLNWDLDEAIYNVENGFQSTLSDKIESCEGIVARPAYNLYDQRGHRIMWKLKTTDFSDPGSRLV